MGERGMGEGEGEGERIAGPFYAPHLACLVVSYPGMK